MSMQNILKRARKSVSGVDIFGQPVMLNLNGSAQFKTACGGVLTILLGVLFGVFTIFQLRQFFNRESIDVHMYSQYDAAPLRLDLPRSTFMFAVSIEQFESAYNKNPFFTIKYDSNVYQRYDNGTQSRNRTDLNLVPCTLDHWKDLGGTYNWTQSFHDLQMQNWLCPEHNSEVLLQGAFDSPTFSFLRFSVVPCDPTETPNCATDEDRQKHLEKHESFRFQLYTSNYILNPDRYEPIDTYLLSALQWQFVPEETFVESNIYMQQYNVETDMSLMPYEDVQVTSVPVLDQREQQSASYSATYTGRSLAKFYLRRSYFTQVYQRQFQKISDLLSYIGGFVQAFIMVVAVLLSEYTRQRLVMHLANELYDFDAREEEAQESSKRRPKVAGTLATEGALHAENGAARHTSHTAKSRTKAKSPTKNDSTLNQTVELNASIANDECALQANESAHVPTLEGVNAVRDTMDFSTVAGRNVDVTPEKQDGTAQHSKKAGAVNGNGAEVHKSVLPPVRRGAQSNKIYPQNGHQPVTPVQYHRKGEKRRTRIGISINYLLYAATCGHCMRSKRNRVIQEAASRVEEHLDLQNILARLHQFERMQKLLLDDDQRVVLNYCPKEVLRVSDQDSARGERDTAARTRRSVHNGAGLEVIVDGQDAQTHAQCEDATMHDDAHKVYAAYKKIAIDAQKTGTADAAVPNDARGVEVSLFVCEAVKRSVNQRLLELVGSDTINQIIAEQHAQAVCGAGIVRGDGGKE